MIDNTWLSAWVQPQHLDSEALQSYHKNFISHPARMIVLKDFLREEVAKKLSQFLTIEAEYKTKFGLYSEHESEATLSNVDEEEWERAVDAKRFYRFGEYTGVAKEFKLSPNMITFLKFRTAYYGTQFKELFEQITGLPLRDGPSMNGYAYRQGDYLRTHNDIDSDKRLTYVFYLNPQWKSCFGGALYMTGSSGEVAKIEAEYNSLILFDVRARAKHFVAPINPCAGETARTTLSGWWHESA